PLAVLLTRVVLLKSAEAPLAVLKSPVVLKRSVSFPNAVLNPAPLPMMLKVDRSAPEPPAVFKLLSLTVGFTPWPQPGVLCSRRTRPVAIANSERAIGFSAISTRRRIGGERR